MAGIGAYYDPRQQAHISLTYKAHEPDLSATKSCELSRLYATGRSTTGSLYSRPGSIKSARPVSQPYYARQQTEFETNVHPPFLDRNGKWVQAALPTLLADSQGQAMTSTGRLDSTLGGVQAPRAISAVHTYNDISPVITTEYARDTDVAENTWDCTINKRGTRGVYEPAGPPTTSRLDTLVDSLRPATTSTMAKRTAANTIGDATARKAGVDSFWQRTGRSTHLSQRDIVRIGDERGTHAVPGSANCRLVAGKWRYIPRPMEGTHLFTDFYGRYDNKPSDYWGRTHHYLPQ